MQIFRGKGNVGIEGNLSVHQPLVEAGDGGRVLTGTVSCHRFIDITESQELRLVVDSVQTDNGLVNIGCNRTGSKVDFYCNLSNARCRAGLDCILRRGSNSNIWIGFGNVREVHGPSFRSLFHGTGHNRYACGLSYGKVEAHLTAI